MFIQQMIPHHDDAIAMSELALKRIREAKHTCATQLDLGNCGLTELPVVASAPAAVVDGERKKLADSAERIRGIEEILARL